MKNIGSIKSIPRAIDRWIQARTSLDKTRGEARKFMIEPKKSNSESKNQPEIDSEDDISQNSIKFLIIKKKTIEQDQR